MTLRRLVLGTLLAAFPGPTAPVWATDLVAEGLAGHVLFGTNVANRAQVAALCASLRAAGPSVLIAIDEEGGDVTRLGHRTGSPYPGNAVLGIVDDVAVTRAIYRAIGADLAAVGINLDLAPTVDVNSTAANPVIGTRSFGADPALVARHAAAAVAGLRDSGVAACAKHFPGHGATTVDSHLSLPTIDASLSTLRLRDLPPFEAAVAAGVPAVMTAHIRVPSLTGSLPATFSRPALALLRALRFDGVIVTDALEMQAAARVAGGVAAGAVMALQAGADLLCVGADVTSGLVEEIVAAIIAAVDDGSLPVARVEEAATRVWRLASGAPWPEAARVRDLASGAPLPAAASVRELASGAPMPEAAPVGIGRRGGGGSGGTGVDSVGAVELGLAAARAAISIEGELPDLSRAVILQLESERTIAEGRVPWGILPHVDAARRSSAMRVVAAAASASSVVEAADGHPIVVTGRGIHRLVGAAALIEALAASLPVVVVEMGWPSPWRPQRIAAFVTTYGASNASGRAAAEALKLRIP